LTGGSQQSSTSSYIPRDATHLAYEVEVMKRHGEAKAARHQSGGRGGPDNTAAPRYQEQTEDSIAQNGGEMVEQQRELKAARRQSTGRGGLGNMTGSIFRIDETEGLNTQNEMIQRQREVKEARRQSIGRGGVGNIAMTGPIYREETEGLIAQNENEMIQRHRELKAARRQSIGRGGLGNIDQSQVVIQEYEIQPTQQQTVCKPNSLGRRGLRSIFRFISRGLKKTSRQAPTSSTLVTHKEFVRR